MKRFFQTAVVCLFIWSCNTRTNNPSVINETYNPTDEELYAACAELQGVGQFIIGRTTFKQVLADNDFKKTVIYSFDKKSNLFNGHWGSKFWKAKDVAYELPGGDKEKWIIRKAGNTIKQLPSSVITGFSIGELEFDTFDMAFLNDTLVAIYFYPEDKVEDKVISHYKEKYGNGRGKLFSSEDTKYGKKPGEITSTKILDEEHRWENNSIALVYENHKYFHMAPGQEPTGSYEHSMMIYSKVRYPIFEDMLLGFAAEYDNNLQSRKDQILNSL